jgi:hypothetical protein
MAGINLAAVVMSSAPRSSRVLRDQIPAGTVDSNEHN